ncbi:MAG: DarT ssDNA thymidine ADP-ribosyltransferase family protein [Endozoicomonas sp.]|uniref:DarT ssDNA thymidine ADP-ribosyltransferase family protein n=1 Tax=Endozoicomonas sp. TaxID=1892382 RepID=UPI003D9B7F4E
MPRSSYQYKKLLYHLTPLSNLENILECGLLPRNQLNSGTFDDVTNADILTSRERQELGNYVPLPLLSRNPL